MTVFVLQHQNFEEQMQGMKTQLIQLSTLLRLLDLAFWNYLGTAHQVTSLLSGQNSWNGPVTCEVFCLCFRVSGVGFSVLLLPVAADPIQEGAELPGCPAALGGPFGFCSDDLFMPLKSRVWF